MEATETISNAIIYQKLNEMQKSLEFLSAKFDKTQNENKELKKILKTQDKDNKMLKERLSP